jgi:hypothetical protein
MMIKKSSPNKIRHNVENTENHTTVLIASSSEFVDLGKLSKSPQLSLLLIDKIVS